MTDDPDTIRAAHAMIANHGKSAAEVAATRAYHLKLYSENLSASAWERIAEAITQIESGDIPPPAAGIRPRARRPAQSAMAQ